MTREEKIARANEMRWKMGLTLYEIADQLGVSQTTASRWTNRERAARDRIRSWEWKDQNREANRRRDREYHYATRPLCPKCKANPMVAGSRSCWECWSQLRRERWPRIAELYLAGVLTLREIGEEVGMRASTVGADLTQMRREGWTLPHRKSGYLSYEQLR